MVLLKNVKIGWTQTFLSHAACFYTLTLENSMDRGSWQATVHGVAKSQTRLSDFHFTHFVDLPAHLICDDRVCLGQKYSVSVSKDYFSKSENRDQSSVFFKASSAIR